MGHYARDCQSPCGFYAVNCRCVYLLCGYAAVRLCGYAVCCDATSLVLTPSSSRAGRQRALYTLWSVDFCVTLRGPAAGAFPLGWSRAGLCLAQHTPQAVTPWLGAPWRPAVPRRCTPRKSWRSCWAGEGLWGYQETQMGQKMVRFGALRGTRSRQDESIDDRHDRGK
jgi:hypothetical protein